jgi:hypothetical protein
MVKPIVLIPAAVLCFGAGWALDHWAGQRNTLSARDNIARVPASLKKTAADQTPETKATEPASNVAAAPTARTLDDLLELHNPNAFTASMARIHRALRGKSAAELGALAAECAKRVSPEGTLEGAAWMVGPIIMERWMDLDPLGSLEFGFPHPEMFDGSQGNLIEAAAKKALRSDLAAGTRLMAKAGHRWRETYIFARVDWVESLQHLPPEKALPLILEFDLQTGNDAQQAQALNAFPAQWIKKDAPTAMNWALALPPGWCRSHVLANMVSSWAVQDAAAARAFMESVPAATLPAGTLRTSLLESLERGTPKEGGPDK